MQCTSSPKHAWRKLPSTDIFYLVFEEAEEGLARLVGVDEHARFRLLRNALVLLLLVQQDSLPSTRGDGQYRQLDFVAPGLLGADLP